MDQDATVFEAMAVKYIIKLKLNWIRMDPNPVIVSFKKGKSGHTWRRDKRDLHV